MSTNESALAMSLEALEHRLATLETNGNVFFLMINAVIIYFMQAGFALLECGSVRSKNATSVLLKNYVDTVFCGVAYWLFGYALAFGGDPNPFCGTRFWAGESMDSASYMKWFFQFAFASKAVTIVSGAVTERCRIDAYMAYSLIMSALIYPIQSHWAWDPSGWLLRGSGEVGFQDFAGSGVIHLCGGAIAFVAAAIVGPRLGRFKEKDNVEPLTHHNAPLYALGGFILFVGFFCFNGASQQAITGTMDGFVASNAVRNTAIAGSFATVTGLFYSKIVSHVRTGGHGRWSLFATVNAGLCGLVAICASCDKVHDWGAAAIGVIAGLTYFFWSWLIVKIRVDDAIDAVAVHFGGGFWGLIAQPIFKQDGLLFKVATPEAKTAWMALGWNLAGAAAIIAWAMVTSFVVFGFMALCRCLRVSEEVEREGMDSEAAEEECYPPTAYSAFSSIRAVPSQVSVITQQTKIADFSHV